jgi:hypothetical protein
MSGCVSPAPFFEKRNRLNSAKEPAMKKLIASLFAVTLMGAAASAGVGVGVHVGDRGTALHFSVNDHAQNDHRARYIDHRDRHRERHCVAWRSYWHHHHRERYCAHWSHWDH